MTSFLLRADGYKLGHFEQYPKGIQRVYSNFTARISRNPDQNKVVFLGLQHYLQKVLVEEADVFFKTPRNIVLDKYRKFLNRYLSPKNYDLTHIEQLHKRGYIPLRFKALPEGASVPLRTPMFTIENTDDESFWVTNYIETDLSANMWAPCTSATTAQRYFKLLQRYSDPGFIPYQAHDFSYRGMMGTDAAALSGIGHLVYFDGTDNLPAMDLIENYYGGLTGVSVPATEHSVMCAGGQDDELGTYNRLLDTYPTGILSVVSDTWDLWNVIDNILPKLKDKIMAREGKLVIRPDSGDPVDIICGYNGPFDYIVQKNQGESATKGVVQLLWEQFGGTEVNGLKVLDSHIGTIYGDSITEARAEQICSRLIQKGFSPVNIVFGIGSYTYQYTTRDVYGFAIKATWTKQNGEERLIQKDPVTDKGGKKSAKGRLVVGHDFTLYDGLSQQQEEVDGKIFGNMLQTVWENGSFTKRLNWDDVRANAKRYV
jgi:nicotinamide phosphoribosyltransferase